MNNDAAGSISALPTRILITGAGGFIGSRLCERLQHPHGLAFRALVRNSRSQRLAAMGAEVVRGDLVDASAAASAVVGCDAVVHLAHGEDAEAPCATRNIVDACVRAKVRRFVHVSSISVHGMAPGPEAAREETARIVRCGDSYCDSKAEEEEIVQRAIDEHGLPAVILRPTVVYGPHSPFVLDVVRQARSGVVSLIDGGAGICNAVFVDDVCDAVVHALRAQGAIGQAMFINADHAVTWREFALAFSSAAQPGPAFTDFSSAAVRNHWEAQRAARAAHSGSLRGLLGRFSRKVTSAPVLRVLKAKLDGLRRAGEGSGPEWPSLGRLIRETCTVEFSNEKAKRLLDWCPRTLAEGAAETTRWVESAAAGMAKQNG